MRLINALYSDLLFMFKQGFFTVYVIITALYSVMLSLLPASILAPATALTIFSDPSVLGLFFVGGVVMLEKEQGVLFVLVVTPLKNREYLVSKIVTFTVLSLVSSLAIVLLASPPVLNMPLFLFTVALTSPFFTMCGIMVSLTCSHINAYMLKMVPYMLLLVLPCLSLIGFRFSEVFLFVPSVAGLKLLLGAFSTIDPLFAAGLLFYLALVNSIFFRITLRSFEHRMIFND